MIKKYNKILFTTLLFFLLLFCAFITTVSAKEVTLDELTEKVKEIEPDTTYLYIVGKYAFTSEHILTTQDIMLASRSIIVSDINGETNSDAIYNEMTIAYIEGNFDNNGNLTGFEYVSNIVGKTQQPQTYDIQYIDYVESFRQISVYQMVEEACNTINAANKFELSMTDHEIYVNILDTEMDDIEDLRGTGAATAAENFLNEKGIKTVTINGVVVDLDDLTNETTKNELKALRDSIGTKSRDLIGKTFTVVVGLRNGCTTNTGATAENFTVVFGRKNINVINLAQESAEKLTKDKFEVSVTEHDVYVDIIDTEINDINDLQGTGLATAINDIIDENIVKTVTINGVVVDLDDLTNETTKNELKALRDSLGTKSGDLIGKTLTVEVELRDGCTTNTGSTIDSFTISFR